MKCDVVAIVLLLAAATAIAQQSEGTPENRGCTALSIAQRTFDGHSVKALVSGTISSPFGLRKHPIFGFLEFHQGTDIAAYAGSPIRTVIAGVVEEVARKGTYGLYVRIRHSVDCETAYAHLGAFAPGVRPGAMLQPGDILGMVGSTGLSTGPHLHFEVIMRGTPVDPLYRAQPPVAKVNTIPHQTSKAPLRVRAARKSRKRK